MEEKLAKRMYTTIFIGKHKMVIGNHKPPPKKYYFTRQWLLAKGITNEEVNIY